jgi:hypothetical protein
MSGKGKRISRKQLEQLIELLEPPIEPPSISDEALIRAVIAHHGWSYEEARERLELSEAVVSGGMVRWRTLTTPSARDPEGMVPLLGLHGGSEASSWQTRVWIRDLCTSVTRTSSTRCATPSFRRTGSETSGRTD